MQPLVSILIPAYNAEDLISVTLQSALDQTWKRKEIIVLDDGSADRTADVARQFAAKGVVVVSTKNQGVAAARNQLLRMCQGEYIQWLDADDILGRDKVELQLAALREGDSKRVLLSSPWAYFYYRTSQARFTANSLWQDLSPAEWLRRKMSENLHMQTATWLTSRELAEAAGPFDTALVFDDDGEYFCRVLMASEGTRFVPEAKVFYRVSGAGSVSHIGASQKKIDSLRRSMKLHVQYLRRLEDSPVTRKACISYLQVWYDNFYPERPDIMLEMQLLATELGGRLEEPQLRGKYAWMKPILGWRSAKWAQRALPQLKDSWFRHFDRAIYRIETRRGLQPER